MLVLAAAGLRFIAALFASVLIKNAHSSTQCSISTPAGAWTPQVAYKAAQAGFSKISVPSKQNGYNRSIRLNGFCHNVLFASNQFTCDTTAAFEKRLNAIPNNGLEIIYAEKERCELSAISLAKVGDGGAEIQFRFETCDAGVATAIVAVPLVKTTSESAMLQWVSKVCEDTLPQVETQEDELVDVAHEKELKLLQVGPGLCNGEFMRNESAPDTEAECTAVCGGTIGVDETHDTCSGYAFNANAPSDRRCMLFKGNVDGATGTDANWTCFSLKLADVERVTVTPTPDPLLAEAELQEHLQLKVAEAMGGPPPAMETAQMRAIAPPEDNLGCFASARWFNLENIGGYPGHFPINEADWEPLMAMIPEPMGAPDPAPSRVTLDRFLVISDCSEIESPKIATWGKACPSLPEKGWEFPKLSVPCRIFEISNAILTGIITPVVTWIAVRAGYDYLKPKYKKPDDLIDPCSIPILGILSGVAFLAAVITAVIVSQICNLIALIAGCAAPWLELSILTSAAFFAASVAVMVALAYLFVSHPKGQEAKKKKDKTYLVMEVEEGENGAFATPVYLDSNKFATQAGSESVLMSSHGPHSSTRSIMLTG